MVEVCLKVKVHDNTKPDGFFTKTIFAPFAWKNYKRFKSFEPTKQAKMILKYFPAWEVDDPYYEKKMNGWKV